MRGREGDPGCGGSAWGRACSRLGLRERWGFLAEVWRGKRGQKSHSLSRFSSTGQLSTGMGTRPTRAAGGIGERSRPPIRLGRVPEPPLRAPEIPDQC